MQPIVKCPPYDVAQLHHTVCCIKRLHAHAKALEVFNYLLASYTLTLEFCFIQKQNEFCILSQFGLYSRLLLTLQCKAYTISKTKKKSLWFFVWLTISSVDFLRIWKYTIGLRLGIISENTWALAEKMNSFFF